MTGITPGLTRYIFLIPDRLNNMAAISALLFNTAVQLRMREYALYWKRQVIVTSHWLIIHVCLCVYKSKAMSVTMPADPQSAKTQYRYWFYYFMWGG